ncbi:hypothetical protein [Alkaliphilus pronyensis]|uniref:hypothetical protein n=1 Tax=Alkaliphilus pronyensis TaxID=1482732 RepID=UPI0018657BFC|nr:hypothetical protein [Alkaliphilus pronyensis]
MENNKSTSKPERKPINERGSKEVPPASYKPPSKPPSNPPSNPPSQSKTTK